MLAVPNIRFFHAQNTAKFQMDPDAETYLNVVLSEGGTVTEADRFGMSMFFKEVKDYGIFPKLRLVWPVIGGTSNAHAIQAIGASSSHTNNLIYTGSPSHSANGMIFNGASNWANTSYIMTAGDQNNFNLVAAVSDLGGRGVIGGAFQNGVVASWIYPTNKIRVNNNGSLMNSLSPYGAPMTASYANGFVESSGRVNATTMRIARRQFFSMGVNVNSPSLTPPTAPITIGKGNPVGGVGEGVDTYGFYEIRFFAITDTLTVTETDHLNACVERLQSRIGRNIYSQKVLDFSLATPEGLFMDMNPAIHSISDPYRIQDSIQSHIYWNLVNCGVVTDAGNKVIYTGIQPEGFRTRKHCLCDMIDMAYSDTNGWTEVIVFKWFNEAPTLTEVLIGHEPLSYTGSEIALSIRSVGVSELNSSFAATSIAAPYPNGLAPGTSSYRMAVVRRNGSTIKVNLELSSVEGPVTPVLYNNPFTTPCAGGRISETNQFCGNVARYQAYNRNLTDAEITTLYNQLKPIYNLP